jgi:hypothetical protein
MLDALSFVEDANHIKNWKESLLEWQKNTLSKIILQIVECCRFIKEYTEKRDGKNFGASPSSVTAPVLILLASARRALENAFSGDTIESRATDFRNTFDSLKRRFEGQRETATQLVLLRFADDVIKDIHGIKEDIQDVKEDTQRNRKSFC